MAVKAMRKLGAVWQHAHAIKKGTEGHESLGFDHSQLHDADVLSAWNEGHGSMAGLLVSLKDHSIHICDTAHSILVRLEFLSGLGPLLWRQHPVGHVPTLEINSVVIRPASSVQDH
jgi:hypothetical protein